MVRLLRMVILFREKGVFAVFGVALLLLLFANNTNIYVFINIMY